MRVLTGGKELFDHLTFGEQNREAIEYVRGELSRAEGVLTDLGRAGWELAKETFHRFNNDESVRRARRLARQVGWVFKSDTVKPLVSLKELQTAQPVMQRWIMACPEVRALHNRQECCGYEGTYIDLDKGKIGDSHYDYQRVMDGLVQTDDPTKPLYTTYMGVKLYDGDRELELFEKVDIMTTWRVVREAIAAGGQDPTSILGDDLG